MAELCIYLDESGDTGWNFDAPYRHGGSSRYLTIAAVLTYQGKKHLPKRLIKKFYKRYNWNPKKEKKWVDLTPNQRLAFARALLGVHQQNSPYVHNVSITVKKENVQPHIRADANKLYNYMIRLLLLDKMKNYERVVFVPDERTVKVESGNSLHDYLQMELWFTENAQTKVTTIPSDSQKTRNLQYADMLCGLVQSHFEDNNSEPFNIAQSGLGVKCLFF